MRNNISYLGTIMQRSTPKFLVLIEIIEYEKEQGRGGLHGLNCLYT
jgi:hypothetical protein